MQSTPAGHHVRFRGVPRRRTHPPGLPFLPALALLCLGCGGDADPSLDAASIRRGAAVYGANCASCHGARGEATPDWKRPDAHGDYPPPPHDSTGHTWHHADGLLYRIVATGVTDRTSRRPSRMPGFGAVLTDAEIRDVITYLRTLWTPAQRRRQADASRDDPFPKPPPAAPR